MTPTPFKLFYQVVIGKKTIEIWTSMPEPTDRGWHLIDFSIRVNDVEVELFTRRVMFGEALNAWEKQSGLEFAGYPGNHGSPHWLHQRTKTYYRALDTTIGGPYIFKAVDKPEQS